MTVRVMPIKYALLLLALLSALCTSAADAQEAAGRACANASASASNSVVRARRQGILARPCRSGTTGGCTVRGRRSCADADPRWPAAPLPDPHAAGAGPGAGGATRACLSRRGGHAEYMADDTRYGLVAEADRAGSSSSFPTATAAFRAASWPPGMPVAAAATRATRASTTSASCAPSSPTCRRECASTRRASSPPACPTAP